MPFATVGDIEIYYELHGSGPPLLDISGSGNDLRVSRPDQSPLTGYFTVLSYDQRGLGQTSKPDEDYTMAQYADDAAGLLDAVGWDRVPVVGTSFGGMVAQNVAVRHLDRVERLVLACTSSGGVGGSSYDLLSVQDLPPDEQAHRWLELIDTRYDRSTGVLPPGLETIVEWRSRSAQLQTDPAVAMGARRQLAARLGHDVADALGGVTVPTLVIGGRYDGIAPTENLEAIAARLPDARLVLCEGGHVFMMQEPEAAWSAILDFLLSGR